jgi:hypothetical protein
MRQLIVSKLRDQPNVVATKRRVLTGTVSWSISDHQLTITKVGTGWLRYDPS